MPSDDPPTSPRRSALRRWAPTLLAALPCWFLALALVWPDRPYRIDLLSNFVPHFAMALALLALLLLSSRRTRGLAPAAGSAGLALATWHAASCSPPRALDAGAPSIRVVHYNAHSERSASDAPFIEWLRSEDPDLVCLVETPWSFAAMHPWVRDRYPYRVEPHLGLQWPNLLLSKFPLTLKPMEADDPQHTFSFVARRSVLVSPPAAAPFIWTAFHPPSPRRESSWRRALDETRRDAGILARQRASEPIPILVTGDFNAAPTARLVQEFQSVSGLTAWTPTAAGGTWPSALSPWFAVPIDRPATTRDLVVADFRVGPQFKSDHRPVVFRVGLPPRSESFTPSGISEPQPTPAR